MSAVTPYAKAIVGAIIAFLSSLATVLVDDASLNDITSGQWVTAIIAFLVALGAIWAIPNSQA